jgi:hypothetical protein
MPPIANLVLGYGDLGEPPRRVRTGSGHRGERDFWVDTHDEDEALAAIGLPSPDDGTPWSPAAPNLQCIELASRYAGGRNDTITGTGGVTLVRATYETPGFGGRLPVPEVGRKFTDLIFEEITTTQHYDIRFDGAGAFEMPLANGDGVPRESSRMMAECYYYVAPTAAAFNMQAMWNVIDRLNADTIQLPPLLGTNIRYQVPPLKARMKAPRVGMRYGKLEIVFRLALSADHKAYSQIENSRGQAVLTQVIEQYTPVQMSSFFP